jgi:excisionase family DNA binding protein
MSRNRILPDVLTLAEAARYLRVTEKAVKQRALSGDIPGRQIGKEWRFLKAALDDWLRRPNSKTVLLQMAGAFKDDEQLVEICKAAYAARGRPMADKDLDS